jgi:hypothetical protein
MLETNKQKKTHVHSTQAEPIQKKLKLYVSHNKSVTCYWGETEWILAEDSQSEAVNGDRMNLQH